MQEAVQILKKLQSVGIRTHDSGYYETKQYLDEWIKTGESATYKYEFVNYRRKCQLILPKKVEHAASIQLFAPYTDE